MCLIWLNLLPISQMANLIDWASHMHVFLFLNDFKRKKRINKLEQWQEKLKDEL